MCDESKSACAMAGPVEGDGSLIDGWARKVTEGDTVAVGGVGGRRRKLGEMRGYIWRGH